MINELIKAKGCVHKKVAVKSSNCSHCKMRMMVMPKKKTGNEKKKSEYIKWHE